MTQQLTEERTQTTDGEERDRMAHYFPKAAIEDNLFTGKPMTALCGKVVHGQRDPNRYPVCQTCREILDATFPAKAD